MFNTITLYTKSVLLASFMQCGMVHYIHFISCYIVQCIIVQMDTVINDPFNIHIETIYLDILYEYVMYFIISMFKLFLNYFIVLNCHFNLFVLVSHLWRKPCRLFQSLKKRRHNRHIRDLTHSSLF